MSKSPHKKGGTTKQDTGPLVVAYFLVTTTLEKTISLEPQTGCRALVVSYDACVRAAIIATVCILCRTYTFVRGRPL